MDTPILLLVYNRPKETEAVLHRLKSFGATSVFVSGDGPKNKNDNAQIGSVRKITEAFNPKHSRFSDTNLGCKKAVISGIDWFFDHVDEGIILEDDCLPCEHFFSFMDDMLNRYRDEEKVTMISGNNPLGEWCCKGGHFFSRIGHIWGWATWKNRWEHFNPELPELNSYIFNHGFERAFGPTDLASSRNDLTVKSLNGEIDTWDYQWMTHLLISGGLAVIPEQNLLENIGFSENGTNVHSKPNWIKDGLAQKPISISDRNIEFDREYEMEWELARRSNQPANRSSLWFEKKGEAKGRSLKILSINSTDIGGGAEKLALSVHQELLNLGHDSKLLVEVKKSELESVVQIEDWKKQIEDFGPEVIHVHNLHGTSISLNGLSEISRTIPFLFTLHDSWLSTGSSDHPFEIDSSTLNFLELKAWKNELTARTSAIQKGHFRFTAPSQWMRELFFNMHGIRPFHVQNAIEETLEAEIEIPSNRYALFVANQPETNPYKDFRTLRKAWKKANFKLEENGFDLLVLGGNSSTEKIGNHSIFMIEKQSSEQVKTFMEKCLFVVQASVQDNSPLTILEAHSAGKKVLGSLVGGIPELLDEQEQSWLYEAGNANDLADNLVKVIRSELSASPLVHPNIKSVVNSYLGHYHHLLDA